MRLLAWVIWLWHESKHTIQLSYITLLFYRISTKQGFIWTEVKISMYFLLNKPVFCGGVFWNARRVHSNKDTCKSPCPENACIVSRQKCFMPNSMNLSQAIYLWSWEEDWYYSFEMEKLLHCDQNSCQCHFKYAQFKRMINTNQKD